MKTYIIQWMHLEKDGQTCERCGNTGAEIRNVIKRLNNTCADFDVQFVIEEIKLGDDEIDKSNMILIDGIPIEDILPEASVSESECCSCGDLTGKQESCRTIIQFGEMFETIPEKMIREAACIVAGCC